VDPVPAGAKVPCLDHDLVAAALKLSSDPLRPRPVGAGVADKEVRRRAHSAPSAQQRHSHVRSTTTGKAVGDQAHKTASRPP
jgi:hypothetical protein